MVISIKSAINDPCGLRNILIIAAFQHAWKYGGLGIFEQTFLYHKYQAVALINAHLRPSQFVPFCAEHINTLCFSEFAFGNFNAAEIHVKGMLLYLETRLLEPEDQHHSITDELCDRYFILAYSMAQGVKGRVNEYLASPAEARHDYQSTSSSQELEQLVPKLYSHETGGPSLCFDTMILLPSFFSSSGSYQNLNPVDTISILDGIREITSLFDVRKSPQSADQDDKSPYKQWIQGAPGSGGPSRLFEAIVNAHIASTLPVPDGPRPDFQSSWIGLLVVLGMYQISVLGVWNSGLPAEDRLLHYILRSSHRDLSKCFSDSMSSKSKAQEFWFWKLFVTALHLAHARTNVYHAWMDDLDLNLLGFIREWAHLTKTRTWEDARGKLIGIVWPVTFDREGLAEALWNKAIGL
ncbi:hypothetical protein NW768_007596 [Fusarium equiseti]|uniref:Uncharacterized protein n=1 Tax=Fusarium equiseti TaxID=61235 RepID=A0ABQ8R7X4_FUSEQ|nr:hypothetical protein NW768_007596 [Fusarium equiseti]